MKLLRCHIAGFGKLSDLALEFGEGLNLVFAANEGGKSTLQRFLTALLYGQLRPDLKSQRRLEAWVEQYKPWRGQEYGGTLWCRLKNGREMEIHRSFGRDDARMEIRTATGEIVNSEYEQQRNGEVLFAQTHMELSKELFESIAIIRESRLTELNSQDSIRDRITNLAQSGAEELSLHQSLDGLNVALDEIGSDRAPTRPYKVALDRRAALQDEIRSLASRRAAFEEWVDERNRLALEVRQFEREYVSASRSAVAARFREAENNVRALEDLEREIAALGAAIEPLRPYTSFPTRDLEELNQASGACSSMEKSLTEVRARIQVVEEQLSHAQAERGHVEAFAAIEAEKISDWFVNYLSLSVKRDEAQKSVIRYRGDAEALEKSLNRLGPALRGSDVDWHRKGLQAAEEERASSDKCLELGEKINIARAQLSKAGARRSQRIFLGCVATLLALAPFAVRYGMGGEVLPVVLPALYFAVALGAAAVALLAAGGRARRDLVRLQGTILALEAEQTASREEGRKTLREIEQAVEDSGYKSFEELLECAKQAEQYRQRLADLSSRAAEKEQQHESFQSECAEVFANIKEALGRVGLHCSPGNIKSQIDAMRSSVRRFRELDGSCRNLEQMVESQRAEETRLAGELNDTTARIQAILAGAGVDSAEAFRECCRKSQRALDLMEKEASRTREYRRLSENLTLEDWRRRVKELEDAMHRKSELKDASQTAVEAPAGTPEAMTSGTETSPEGGSLFLPYLPSADEAELQEKEVASRLASAREEYARIVERVSQAFQGCRTMPEIEEDLALTEQKVAELTRNREALCIAIETIQALSREQQEVLAPQLNSSVERRFLRLCPGRYEEIRVDPEFRIYVRETASGELRDVDRLSRGTQDQVYFALRFGILDLVTSKDETCPCLMDEPFAAYDHQRAIEAFRILEEEAKRRQLFVFTCREDLRDLAQAHGAEAIRLTIDD